MLDPSYFGIAIQEKNSDSDESSFRFWLKGVDCEIAMRISDREMAGKEVIALLEELNHVFYQAAFTETTSS